MILEELKNRGVEVLKSDRFYKGYYNSEAGIRVSQKEEDCEKCVYFLNNGKGFTFPCNDDVVYIAKGTEYEGKVKSNAEAKQLASEGKIYSFKSSDLYAEYYDFSNDKELECVFKYWYSTRSRKYILEQMAEIGLTHYTDESNGSCKPEGEPTELEDPKVYKLFMNAETEVGKIENEKWLAQTCHWFIADDFEVIKMYFDHCPTEQDLRTAFCIKDFERKPIEVFTCRECGNLTNWLDIEGDIRKKIQYAEERYCGC